MSEVRDKIVDIEIEDEMRKSYIDYAMSVIVGRALPDVRDGLKPVHRRILYAMNELSLVPEKGYRKSATVVGDVLGKYHPHGDTAVYDSLVKMAQDFSIRYPLVDGHGNFGSIDGDSAAAMRYTEAKMQKLALEMLKDIDKETVNFVPNYDERLKEPSVLPARYPNLLVNGSNGIAVGMATSIPPHNLREVIDAVIELIENPDATVEDIMEHIQGPDFPTGAIGMGKSFIKQAYLTGRGKITVRSKADIEELPNGKHRIVVSEIPYQVNKSRMIERIAELVKEKRVEGITDIRDESNRNGIRVVIEVKRDVNPNIVLNNLYKHSQMQDVYSIIMLALVNGEPKVLDLRSMLVHYLNHQKDVVTKRTEYELRKAKEREHILKGLLIALDNIDRVIEIIRGSDTGAVAKEKLMEEFSLTDIQSQAILDMRLQRLTGLERGKIENEFNELMESIKYYESILASEEKLLEIIKEEITLIRDKYGDDRRTEITESEDEINIKDTIEDEEVTITLTHHGYIKRIPMDTYKSQRRGGKGISSMTTRDEDFVESIITAANHDRIIFLTNRGRMYRMNVYEIPQSSRIAKGTNIINLLPLEKGEKVTSFLTVRDVADTSYLVMCTKKGIIKKTMISEFRKSKRNGLIAISLREDDELINAKITDGDTNFILVTKEGLAICFDEKQVRDMGRSAMGVRGIRLNEGDEVVSMEIADTSKELLVISENGYGKRTHIKDYRIQSRGGKGVKNYKISEKTGRVVGAKVVEEDEEIMIINSDGTLIRISVNQISILSKVTSGVRVMKTSENTVVAALAKIAQNTADELEESEETEEE